MDLPISVRSEVGRLKTVLLHRPGVELENLMPDYLPHQLFDDIPYLVYAQQEHDTFACILRQCGVNVIYLKNLVCEAVNRNGVREELVRDYVKEAHLYGPSMQEEVKDYLLDLPVDRMFDAMAGGVRKSQISKLGKYHLLDYAQEDFPFYAESMPNLYFTRDPFACLGNGVVISHMKNEIRQRETLFADYIFRYHPAYKNVPHWYERSNSWPIEGGDILVLNDNAIAVGMSERTSPQAIEDMAEKILYSNMGVEQILVINLPKFRTFMHLDTVMTMVDTDKFVVHPNTQRSMRSFLLTRGSGSRKVDISETGRPIDEALQAVMGLDRITLIRCGGASTVDAAREQWNDGANTLAVAPGEIITYVRNHVTNSILRDNGITVHEIPSSELSRGRGGPRCMSMPLVRDRI